MKRNLLLPVWLIRSMNGPGPGDDGGHGHDGGHDGGAGPGGSHDEEGGAEEKPEFNRSLCIRSAISEVSADPLRLVRALKRRLERGDTVDRSYLPTTVSMTTKSQAQVKSLALVSGLSENEVIRLALEARYA